MSEDSIPVGEERPHELSDERGSLTDSKHKDDDHQHQGDVTVLRRCRRLGTLHTDRQTDRPRYFTTSDMELGHILWPSDPVIDPRIQRPGDPVDPVTLFYNELQMSTNVCNGQEVCQFLSLFARFWKVKFWRSFIKCQYFNDGWTDFHKNIIYLYLRLLFENWKTRVSHRVKMMTRWPGRERWPKWPIYPVTQWPSSMSAMHDICSNSRRLTPSHRLTTLL